MSTQHGIHINLAHNLFFAWAPWCLRRCSRAVTSDYDRTIDIHLSPTYRARQEKQSLPERPLSSPVKFLIRSSSLEPLRSLPVSNLFRRRRRPAATSSREAAEGGGGASGRWHGGGASGVWHGGDDSTTTARRGGGDLTERRDGSDSTAMARRIVLVSSSAAAIPTPSRDHLLLVLKESVPLPLI
jgi:hypothetical protein